jgi:hypothetical protein
MNKKNFFDDEDKKYKALEKENDQKKISKPKETNAYKIEEVKDSSSYEIYEGLDNLNCFTIKEQEKVKDFFSRIFALQNFVNIFAKFITKLLILVLENSFFPHKFLGKFASKFRKILVKMLLLLQIKLLLIQLVFFILRLKIQLKILELIKPKLLQKENLIAKNLNFIGAEKAKSTNEILTSRTFFDFESSSEFKKEINRDFLVQEKTFYLQEINSGQKISREFGNLFEIDNRDRNIFERFGVTHGGRDFFHYQVPKDQLSVSNYKQDGLNFFGSLVRFILQITQKARDYILNYNSQETNNSHGFYFSESKEISKNQEKESLPEMKIVHGFKIENASEESKSNALSK